MSRAARHINPFHNRLYASCIWAKKCSFFRIARLGNGSLIFMLFLYAEELNSSTYKNYKKSICLREIQKHVLFWCATPPGRPPPSVRRRPDVPDTAAAVDPNPIMKRIYIGRHTDSFDNIQDPILLPPHRFFVLYPELRCVV